MTKHELLKDAEFEAVAEARVDAKHRVSLGKILADQVTSFRVYRNSHGQIILDPMVSVPAHEAWLFKNARAVRLVKQGLTDAKQGKVVKAKEDYSRHIRGED